MVDPNRTQEIARTILESIEPVRIFSVTLDEFRDIYVKVQEGHPNTHVDIVLNGLNAYAQFTELNNHRLLISKKAGRWSRSKQIDANDLPFLTVNYTLYGQREHLRFRTFVRDELQLNWWLYAGMFIAAILIFLLLVGNVDLRDFLVTVNELVITSGSLFVSIFLLFSVTQNAHMLDDEHLFKDGKTHRFLEIDRLLGNLAIVAIFLAFANRALIEIDISLYATISAFPLFAKLFLAFFSSLAVALLLDCFRSISGYYFHRVGVVIFRDRSKELLDSLMEQPHTRLEKKPDSSPNSANHM